MKVLILMSLTLMSFTLPASSLEVQFSGVRSDSGSLRYILFKNATGYPDEPSKSIRKGSVSATKKDILLTDLPAGQYSMTLIHDENNNDQLDTKLGIPVEGFGFSRNPTIFFGPPSFDRTKFKIPDEKKIKIKMKYI